MPGSIRHDGPSSDLSRPPHAKIYGILKNIQKLRLLSITLEPGFVWNDFLVPYSKEQLPKDENGSLDYATNFMEEQKNFLSETSRLAQSIKDFTKHSDEGLPPHIQTNAISDVFQVSNWLGRGRYGEVHRVELQASESQDDDSSSDVFALKRMRKPAPREDSGLPRSTVSEFETELRHLSKCRHHHIIDLRASFTDETNFGFIVSPVAASTLQELLSNYVSENYIDEHRAVRKVLFEAFGCLLEAVYYLHDTLKIRHRDIKPRNILVHNSRVLICDLGSAYDFEPLDRNESTEASRPPGTRKYKAPEVLESINSNARRRHNRKVDIFSLGCVFLEMHTVLCEQTLDRMAKFITQNETTEFEGERGDWTYASSLENADSWLGKIYEPDGLGEGPTSLIKSMLCREHSERKSAEKLSQEVRIKYLRYVGDCCKQKMGSPLPSPPDLSDLGIKPDGLRQKAPGHNALPGHGMTNRIPSSESSHVPMGPSMPRPITSCKIGRRQPISGSQKSPNYGEHIYFADYPQDGELEFREDRRSDAWATTRSTIVKMLQSPRSIEEQWLPAYYVNLTRNKRKITLEWSDCDQLVTEKHDGQTLFQKVHSLERGSNSGVLDMLYSLTKRQVHYSITSRNNLLMEVEFEDELDAADFYTRLLEEPTEGCVRFEVRLLDHRLFTIREYEWRYADKSGAGSHVACLRQSLESTQPSRLEPLFVPHDIDFTLPLGREQRYTKLSSKSFWVPRYRSNMEEEYELPEGKAIFESVGLSPLRNEYCICFEEASGSSYDTAYGTVNKEALNHLETTVSCNENLQQFLSILTGWNLLVVFAATNAQPKRRLPKKERPADVLCFRKGQETRIAIRRKHADEGYTIDWTSATLATMHVDTKASKLDVKLMSIQKGQTLTLATVTAANGETEKNTDKMETWIITVGSASGELYSIINKERPRQEREW